MIELAITATPADEFARIEAFAKRWHESKIPADLRRTITVIL